MTAITYADRSTQVWGDDALGPKGFETSNSLSVNEVKERRLYAKYPELEHHADVEWAVLQRWVAFKMAPAFVEQLYDGEPLHIERTTAVEEHIIPEFRTSRTHYFSESAYIVGTQIPELNERIRIYSDEAAQLEASVAQTLDKIDSGDRSPKLKLDAASWYRQSVEKRTLVSKLEADIPKSELNARVKDVCFYRISDLIDHLHNGQQTDTVDEIIYESKKIAMEQVINSLKSDRALVDMDGDDGETIVRGYNRRIELLEIELRAFEDIVSEDTEPVAAEFSEVTEQNGFLKDLQRRLIGNAGSRAAALYDAIVK